MSARKRKLAELEAARGAPDAHTKLRRLLEVGRLEEPYRSPSPETKAHGSSARYDSLRAGSDAAFGFPSSNTSPKSASLDVSHMSSDHANKAIISLKLSPSGWVKLSKQRGGSVADSMAGATGPSTTTACRGCRQVSPGRFASPFLKGIMLSKHQMTNKLRAPAPNVERFTTNATDDSRHVVNV